MRRSLLLGNLLTAKSEMLELILTRGRCMIGIKLMPGGRGLLALHGATSGIQAKNLTQ
jgi:hypothetical protein